MTCSHESPPLSKKRTALSLRSITGSEAETAAVRQGRAEVRRDLLEETGRVAAPQRSLCQPSLQRQAIFFMIIGGVRNWYMKLKRCYFFRGGASHDATACLPVDFQSFVPSH